MKKIIIALGVLFVFCSCSEFRTAVSIKNPKPPIVDKSPILIYFSEVDNLPDSSEYIGDFAVTLKLDQNGFGGYRAMVENLINSIQTPVKAAGGNLIMIDPTNKKEKNSYMKGKFYYTKPLESTDYTEADLKNLWKTRKPDAVEGIYERQISMNKNVYKDLWVKYGVLKTDSLNYLMIYLNGFEEVEEMWGLNDLAYTWQTGNIYAYLQKTDNKLRFKSKVYSYNKSLDEKSYIKIDNGNLRISRANAYSIYMKVFPDSSQYESLEYSLTGFAIDSNRILTCYHGVKDTDYKMFIKGINGNFDTKYEAVVENIDKNNDIAVIRLLDANVKTGLNPLPLTEEPKEIAEEVFVMGYPISSLMGEEIKVTNGIINSTSGIAGNSEAYQISAPIQPGNSGSPVFDKNGNIIGMVTSGISEADNVGYSLKYEAIKKFIDKNNLKTSFDSENSIQEKSLTEKVKYLKKSIYLIEIIDTKRPKAKVSKSKLRRE